MSERTRKVSEARKRLFLAVRQATKRNVCSWTAADCMKWLKEEGFEDFSLEFYHNGFCGSELLRIDERTFSSVWARAPQRCIELAEAINRLRLLENGTEEAPANSVSASNILGPRQRPALKRQQCLADEDPSC